MSRGSALTSIALVVLALVATAYAYLVDQSAVSDADRVARRSDVFPTFRVDDVRRVELTHGVTAIVLERDPGAASAWTLTLPRRERADSGAVDALLRELSLARRLRDVPETEAVSLEAPRVRGRLAMGKIEYRFALGGDAHRPEGAAYMRLEGEGAFVVDRTLVVQLLRGADAYRERALVPYAAADVARLEVESGSDQFVATRRGDRFSLGDAVGLRASRKGIESAFAALADTRAEVFLDDNVADQALSAPVTTVRVVPRQASQSEVRLRLGGVCPGQPGDVVVVRDTPSRVSACVPKSGVASLVTTSDALVDRNLFYAHADEVEELRLEALAPHAGRVELARRGTGWRERAPANLDLGPEENDSATALVADIAMATALDVWQAAAGERFAARVRASITRTGGGSVEVIEVGAEGSDGVSLARRVDDGAVLRLAHDVARRLEPRPIALRKRAIWATAMDPTAIVAIDDSCGPEPERLELRGGRWVLSAPSGFAADATVATDLTDAFAHARADAWIAERDDGTFGFGASGACTVTLALTGDGDARLRPAVAMLFGGSARGGAYARTRDDPAVFVAPEALRELASHPAIDRTRLRLNADAVVRVTLARGSARITLVVADGGVLVRSGVHKDDAGVDRLGAAVASFYSHAALHAGAPSAAEGFDRPTLEIDATARVDAGAWRETSIVVGAPTRVGPLESYFARVSGIDATFAVPKRSVDAIFEAW